MTQACTGLSPRALLALAGICAAVACSDGAEQGRVPREPETGGSGGRDPKPNLSSSGGQNPTVIISASGGHDDADDECHREVSLEPVVLGEPQPFDLVIVADHSASLAWSRDSLASGLHDLLAEVRGRSVRVFLLTPTQYGESSSEARVPGSGAAAVAWQDPKSGTGYSPAVTVYSQVCTDERGASITCPDPTGGVPYHAEGSWQFVLPEPIAIISPDLSDPEFAAQQQDLASAILGLVGSGSPKEQPLCTLARYVTQDPATLPNNAVFLLLTDEDDTSLPEDCLVGYRADLVAKKSVSSVTACSADCDAHSFKMDTLRRWPRFEYTCMALTDTGEPIPGTEVSSYYDGAGTCNEGMPRSCSGEERAAVQPRCGSGLSVVDCERTCQERQSPCQLILEEEVDACTESFTYNGKTWANFAEHCASLVGEPTGLCTAEGVNLEYQSSVFGNSTRTPLVKGTTTDDLSRYFRQKADSVFAPEHYVVLGILLDPAFTCALGPGQSHAKNLASMIGDRSRLFPLCDSYAPALRGVIDFAKTLVQTEFPLALELDEDVTAVTVVGKDGAMRPLPADQYRVDEQTRSLHIEPGALLDTDTDVQVEITSDCRPVPR